MGTSIPGDHAAGGVPWQSTLATHASPVTGKPPLHQIQLAHIVRMLVEILNDIRTSKTETATPLPIL